MSTNIFSFDQLVVHLDEEILRMYAQLSVPGLGNAETEQLRGAIQFAQGLKVVNDKPELVEREPMPTFSTTDDFIGLGGNNGH